MREKKLLTSRQIFRYAVPARTVTKKHWMYENTVDAVALCFFLVFLQRSDSDDTRQRSNECILEKHGKSARLSFTDITVNRISERRQ